MEIVVLNKKVDTKEISDIQEIEHNKRMFLGREAGFIIYRIDKKPLIFGENIPYERTPSEIAEVKIKWDKLQKQVYEKWQKDKSELETFNL